VKYDAGDVEATSRLWVGQAIKAAAKPWGHGWPLLTEGMRHGAAAVELLAIFAAQNGAQFGVEPGVKKDDAWAAHRGRIFRAASERLATFFRL